MPPFGRNRILTEQEINAIVDFLQTLDGACAHFRRFEMTITRQRLVGHAAR